MEIDSVDKYEKRSESKKASKVITFNKINKY
jgi:hypothetical protein